jgi:hypothetical protein
MRYSPLPIFFVILFSVTSCHKEKQHSLSVNKTTFQFSPWLSKDSVIISSTETWSLTVPASASSWLTVDKTSGGPGDVLVHIRASLNVLNAQRSATLIVNSTGSPVAPATITVTQDNEVKVDWVATIGTGGSTMNISGYGFSAVPSENIVTINGVAASVQSSSNQAVIVTVPPKCGSGNVIVKVNTKSDTADAIFIYNWIGELTEVAGSTMGYLDGPALSAQFTPLEGIDFDGSGNLFICDYGNNDKVRKLSAGSVSTIPGRIPHWSNPSGPNTDFGGPTDVTIDAAGNVYVAEALASVISKVTPAGVVSVLAGGSTYGNADGTGSAALFNTPTGITVDAAGYCYVADQANNRIRKISPAGVVTTLAGSSPGFADGTGTAASFSTPRDIELDPATGNLYVADYSNHRIRKVTQAGVVTTVAGISSRGNTNGPVSMATLDNPIAIVLANNGTLYIADQAYELRILTPDNIVSPVIKLVDANTGAQIQNLGIYGVTVDSNNVIYISSWNNQKIYKVTLK